MCVQLFDICLLTPSGVGAIAVVRLEGSGAGAAIDQCFRRHVSSPSLSSSDSPSSWSCANLPLSGLSYGRLIDPKDAEAIGEDVVLARVENQSYEINCHGGRAAIERTIRILSEIRSSADPGLESVPPPVLSWQDWLKRQIPNDSQSTIAWALTQAKTWKTAAILLDQLQGAPERLFAQLADLKNQGQECEAHRLEERFLGFTSLGKRLIRPWRVVLTGRPNAGKSSLLNCLLGFDRAIVNNISGTTRDIVSTETVWDGWPFELIDTAGIRQSDDPLEREGALRAINQLKEADLIVLLHSAEDSPEERARTRQKWARWLGDSALWLEIQTKSDLVDAASNEIRSDAIEPLLSVSVKTRSGIESLRQTIVSSLIPEFPAPGEAVPLTFGQGGGDSI